MEVVGWDDCRDGEDEGTQQTPSPCFVLTRKIEKHSARGDGTKLKIIWSFLGRRESNVYAYVCALEHLGEQHRRESARLNRPELRS